MGARLKRPAYGLPDAPRRWWNRLDKSFKDYGLVPTRGDRCCYVLYRDVDKWTRTYHRLPDDSRPDPELWEANLAERVTFSSWTAHVSDSEATAKVSEAAYKVQKTLPKISPETQLDVDGALELLLDPITGSKAQDRVCLLYTSDAADE